MSQNRSNHRFQDVDANTVAMLDSLLEAEPEKVQPSNTKLTRRDLVVRLYDRIVQMKRKGYSSAEICDFIREKTQVVISPATLDNYLQVETRRRKRERKNERRQQQQERQLSQQVTDSPEIENQPIVTPSTTPSVAAPSVELKTQPSSTTTTETVSETMFIQTSDRVPESKVKADRSALEQAATEPKAKSRFNPYIEDRSKL